MDSRRSYLDSLNEGRQRKPSASLEHLSRSLEQLEQQLSLRQRAQEVVRAQGHAGLEEDRPAPRYSERRDPFWGKNDPSASVERFTREFQALKAEMLNSSLARQEHMREQVGSDLRREFEALRHELERSYESANERTSAQLDAEIKRLGKAIQQSKDRSDDKSVNLLRLEIEQIKNSVAGLAREDTVRTISERWDEFERRIAQPNFDQAIDALSERLEQIGAAVGSLPEQLSIDRFEDRLRNLAELIEQFVDQEGSRSNPESITAIESRLEEISRSIVAISMADQKNTFDPEMIDRLDARIVALARQIEEASSETDAAILARLDTMADKIAAMADNAPAATEEVSRELAKLNKKMAAAALPAGFEKSLEQLEKRIIDISDRIEAQAAGDEAILGLQHRVDALHTKFDSQQGEPLDPSLIRALEAQLTALSAHLEQPNPVASGLAELTPRLERIEAAVAEGRDELVETARLAAEEVLRNFAGSPVEAAAIAGLTDDLKALETLTRDADDRNTRTFDAIHETLIKIIDRIGQLDLSEQFIVKDDAPLAIVEPEAEVEAAEEEAETVKVDVGQAPSIDMDEVPPLEEETTSFEFNFEPLPTPAQTAADDGEASVTTVKATEGKAEQPSGLSRWKRIFQRREDEARQKIAETGTAEDETAPLAAAEAVEVEGDANMPLEPGATPDLNTIMRRVREDRNEPDQEEERDTARSDFIAAARRAAQAAAAEADLMKRSASEEKPARKSVLASILKGRRRPILLAAAAIMAALAGLQLGKAFVKDPVEIAGAGSKPAVVTPVANDDARSLDKTATGSVTKAQEPKATVKPEVKPAAAVETKTRTTNAAPASPDERVAMASTVPDVPAARAPITQDIPSQVGPVALREAARNGDAKALYVVGSRLAEGAGLSSNMQAAAKWFEQSAELGFAPAQYRIGNLYEKGIGVERDLMKARHWYQLAANQGSANAMHNLAVLYATGADIAPDNEAAVRWFTKAAALGVKDSQYNLGILAAKGAGTAQDMEQAYKWFGLVANTGDRDAVGKRDEVAKAMNAEQIDRAKSAIAAWKAETPDAQANEVTVPDAWQEPATTTAQLDMGKAIRNVQALLNKAGYDVGMADGLIGDKTRQAIAAFQEDHGLKPTGRIDEKMVRALLAKN